MKQTFQEEEEISDSEDELEDRNKVAASPLSPLTPLETPTNAPAQLQSGDHWQQKGKNSTDQIYLLKLNDLFKKPNSTYSKLVSNLKRFSQLLYSCENRKFPI